MASTPVITEANLAKAPFYWGIDVGGTGIKIGLVDSNGQTLVYQRIATRESEGPDSAVQRMVEIVRSNEQRLGVANQVARIGLGAPGPMDLPGGLLVQPPQLPSWWNFPIRDVISHLWNAPSRF